jgi:beta-glucosidase
MLFTLRAIRAAMLLAGAALLAQPRSVSEIQEHGPSEDRIESLLAEMTLEEKFGQLQQLDGMADGQARPEHAELARRGLLGSTLNVRGVKQVNALQTVAVEQSRLKIPLLFAFDVIHGYRTVFPIPLG